MGRAIPYSVYDIGANQGWVSVDTDHGTAAFTVEIIRRWWQQVGARTENGPRRLFITVAGGAINSGRSPRWSLALQPLADDRGLRVTVRHVSPGTRERNTFEHRLLAHITANCRGR